MARDWAIRVFPLPVGPARRIFEVDLNNEIISVENDEIGKVLINDDYPYALIKVKNEKFDFDKTFNCGSSKVKIKKPDWLQIT